MQQNHLESLDKRSYFDVCKQIVFGDKIQDKLVTAKIDWSGLEAFELPRLPSREKRIQFSDTQIKFPKSPSLNDKKNTAIALHSFANHELLAIEMMASAIMLYPHETEQDLRFKKGLWVALQDEQRHFSLYVERLKELGYEFGDFPLNDFFWRQMEKLKTPQQFSSVMSLTFEAANLDFAFYYKNIFEKFGDFKTANILKTVLEDEITHVSFGAHWLNRWRGEKKLWDYYREQLPFPLTPARSKGIQYTSELHMRAIEDADFIRTKDLYEDDFRITKR